MIRVRTQWLIIVLICFYHVCSCSSDIIDNKINNDKKDMLMYDFIVNYVPLVYEMQIQKNNITWYFNEVYEYGQFANGDYWVVGNPVVINYINPPSMHIGARIINGSMVNPDPTTGVQGYDSSCVMAYSASTNVALDLSSVNPLILNPGSSLISSISIILPRAETQLSDAEILTVLSAAPADGSFRPPYCGADKTIEHNISQLNYTLLRNLALVPGTPDIHTVAGRFARPWIDHYGGFENGFIHPAHNMPTYGREISRAVGIASLMLHLDFSIEEKEELLIHFVQLGIDNYGCVANGIQWENDGGHNAGRKWPILFAGLVLGDGDMSSIGNRSGDYLYEVSGHGAGNPPSDYIHFQEDDQTYYVEQADVDRTHDYNPYEGYTPPPYTTAHLGMPEWGIEHSTYPSLDNPVWTARYRQCCTAASWTGWLLAALMMEDLAGAKTLWNHDALFDYQDRYMAIANGDLDPFGYSVPEEEEGMRSLDVFPTNMWDEYRDDY